ncbi:MAG: LysM peptidoglycan-binding domain-containing protein [Chthoniobacterales bacterium]|nr:LysM peptidoglycan-binding domain-containing protein [Chthoniobacterales bacterium]
MCARDKDRQEGSRRSQRLFADACSRILVLALIASALAGCDRMMTSRNTQVVKEAETRASEGDFLHAINLYESALDGSAGAADIHYRLALLYDDKMHEPLNALHHFKRYLVLAPTGAHASEVKEFMKRGELALVTNMSGDSVVTRAEAARLKNENLTLRKELEERAAQARLAASNEKATRAANPEKASSPGTSSKSATRSHVVETGDTLYSLSRKYYGSAKRWKEIRQANRKSLDASGKLKAGQTVTIP